MKRIYGPDAMPNRIAIAKAVAENIVSEDVQTTIVQECNKQGISRMALWLWEIKYPVIRAIMAKAKAILQERAEAARQVADTLLAERRAQHRLRRYPRLREAIAEPVVIETEALRSKRKALKCFRCGYTWFPRKSPVYRCPHTSCYTSHFALRGFFSDAEKREALKARLQFDSERAKAAQAAKEAAKNGSEGKCGK